MHLSVSDFKRQLASGGIDRAAAAQLKALVRLGRQLLATELELDEHGSRLGRLGFKLAREDQLLLSGIISSGQGRDARCSRARLAVTSTFSPDARAQLWASSLRVSGGSLECRR